MNLNPKAQLLADEEFASHIRATMRLVSTQRAIECALATYAMTNPGTERITGANAFISVLLNIAEVPTPEQQFPDHSRDIHTPIKPTQKP
jgi:hypothetical protein